jgi:hypothetical protein
MSNPWGSSWGPQPPYNWGPQPPNNWGSNTVDVNQLQGIFQRYAGIDHKIDRAEFAQLYSQLHPEAINYPNYYQIMEGTFSQMDFDRSGRIGFGEFVTGYNRLRGGF